MESQDWTLEFIKAILDFLSKVAYPFILCISLVLFKNELRGILEVLRGIMDDIKTGRTKFKYTHDGGVEVSKNLALQVKEQDLPSATKTIQELLSPAAPLVVGYVENFIARMRINEGGVQFKLLDGGSSLTMAIYTVYIPHELSDEEARSGNLIHAKFPGMDVKKIAIESNSVEGRTLTGAAILHNGALIAVDVPQTLASIRLVFRFREDQLKKNMGTDEIKKMETDSINEFAKILQDRIGELQMSKCVRVIRDPSHLFSRNA
jgi:hypothetical protein